MMQRHNRVTNDGIRLGRQLVRMTEPAIAELESQGEPDERCKTCAFRLGTIPNGCLQTGMDALKAVMEAVPFTCHQKPKGTVICHGWYAAGVSMKGKITKVPWTFSPEDDETSTQEPEG